MRIPFKTTFSEGAESVMVVGDINPDEIRYNRNTKEIFLVTNNVYDLEDLDALSWQHIKNLVLKNDGTWETKAEGIKYLIGREK